MKTGDKNENQFESRQLDSYKTFFVGDDVGSARLTPIDWTKDEN
jgi:hypothetical protein